MALRRTRLARRKSLSGRSVIGRGLEREDARSAPASMLDRRQLIARLDSVARKLTMTWAGWRCARCGIERNLQWHHVYSRSIISLRHDQDNLVCLCSGCHLWWHHNPMDAAAWALATLGAARIERLRLARRSRRRVDLVALLVAYEAGQVSRRLG